MFERIAAALPRRARRVEEEHGQEAKGPSAVKADEAEAGWSARSTGQAMPAHGELRLRMPAIFVVQDGDAEGDN